MSGLVFGMGDLTAQAYEGRGVSTIDWARTARSAAVGIIQGPLGHAVYSSDGCVIDRFVEQQVSCFTLLCTCALELMPTLKLTLPAVLWMLVPYING